MEQKSGLNSEDRADFARLQGLLDEEFRMAPDNSASIHRRGVYFKEVRDRGLYKVAGAKTLGEWTEPRYGFGDRQAGKYINVGEYLSEEEAREYGLEIEGLDQLAHAPSWLRGTLQGLLKREGLGVGPVRRGRLAAVRLRKEGATEERACAEAQRVARRAAGREEVEEEKGRPRFKMDRSLAGEVDRLNRDIVSLTGRAEKVRGMLAGQQEVPPGLACTRPLFSALEAQIQPILSRAPEQATEVGSEVGFQKDGSGSEVGFQKDGSGVVIEALGPVLSAMAKATELHDRIWHMLCLALAEPGAPSVSRGLEKLGKHLAVEVQLPVEQFRQWTGALLAQGPELGEVVAETVKRTCPDGYRQSLERLLRMPLPVPARQHLRSALAAAA